MTIVLQDKAGALREVTLKHEVGLAKQLQTSAYRVTEKALARNEPAAWGAAEVSSTYVSHLDLSTLKVPTVSAPEGTGVGDALPEGAIVENLGEVGRGSSGVVFKVRASPRALSL